MTRISHSGLCVATLLGSSTLALAQTPPADPAASPLPDPSVGAPAPTSEPADGGPTTEPPKEPKKEPGRGDFNAGGQVRLPSGPDEMGTEFATFNWIAVDLKGKYYVFDTVTINGNVPLAVKHPDTYAGVDAKMLGGMSVTLDARLPKWNVPMAPKAKNTDAALILTAAYLRQGAMLLSEKDFPLFIGDMKPGFAGGLDMRVKMSSVIDFKMTPQFVYQSGAEGAEALQAVQIPISTVVKLGETLKVSADLGVFTGDDASFKPSNGGRIYAGGALDLKISKIILHGGAGVASLLAGADSLYPTISDSIYIDLNVKYAR